MDRRARGDAAMSRAPRVLLAAQDCDQLIQKEGQPLRQLEFDWGWSLSRDELRPRSIENLSTISDEEIMERQRNHAGPSSLRSPGASGKLDGLRREVRCSRSIGTR